MALRQPSVCFINRQYSSTSRSSRRHSGASAACWQMMREKRHIYCAKQQPLVPVHNSFPRWLPTSAQANYLHRTAPAAVGSLTIHHGWTITTIRFD